MKANRIMYLYVPQYETLSVSFFFELVHRDYTEVLNYLPDARDQYRLPRQYVINLVYTLVGQPFAREVERRIEERNQTLAMKQDLLITMDSEIARAFQESTMISSK